MEAVGWAWGGRYDLCRFGLRLFVGPQLLVLPTTKPLIVVSFALEQLLEVWLAVEFSLQSCIGPQAVERRKACRLKKLEAPGTHFHKLLNCSIHTKHKPNH